jgi:glutathione S-transferase
MELEIIGAPQSNFVRAVRMVCEEKSVAYTLTPLRPRTQAVEALHPLGKIPAMRHGDFTLFESAAIAAYIDRGFPGPRLFSDDARTAARIEQWVSICNVSLIPMTTGYAVQYFFPSGPDGKPDRAIVDPAIPGMQKALAILDKAVAATGFLAGDGFTYADINLLPALAFLHDCPESCDAIAALENLTAYFKKHSARPSFVKTVPPSFAELRQAG